MRIVGGMRPFTGCAAGLQGRAAGRGWKRGGWAKRWPRAAGGCDAGLGTGGVRDGWRSGSRRGCRGRRTIRLGDLVIAASATRRRRRRRRRPRRGLPHGRPTRGALPDTLVAVKADFPEVGLHVRRDRRAGGDADARRSPGSRSRRARRSKLEPRGGARDVHGADGAVRGGGGAWRRRWCSRRRARSRSTFAVEPRAGASAAHGADPTCRGRRRWSARDRRLSGAPRDAWRALGRGWTPAARRARQGVGGKAGEAMTRAFVFPGQGAQVVGMGRDLARAYPAARAVFEEVDAALGREAVGAGLGGDAGGADADAERAAGADGDLDRGDAGAAGRGGRR